MDLIPVACSRCYKFESVLTISDLQPGDHISRCGRKSHLNWRQFCFGLYRHHSIVSEIIEDNGTSGIVKVIGFDTCEHGCLGAERQLGSNVKEECPFSCIKDLLLQEKEIELDLSDNVCKRIIYEDVTALGKAKVEFARRLIRSYPYNICLYNCEHFCHYVCTKAARSRHAERAQKILTTCVLSVFYWIMLFLWPFLLTVYWEREGDFENRIYQLLFRYSPLVMFSTYKFAKYSERVRKWITCFIQYEKPCMRCRRIAHMEIIIGCLLLMLGNTIHDRIATGEKHLGSLVLAVTVVAIMTYMVPWIIRKYFSNMFFIGQQ